eukprot:127566_1
MHSQNNNNSPNTKINIMTIHSNSNDEQQIEEPETTETANKLELTTNHQQNKNSLIKIGKNNALSFKELQEEEDGADHNNITFPQHIKPDHITKLYSLSDDYQRQNI